MANPEHLAILKQGVKAWNDWRRQNPAVTPALSEADLHGVDLCLANLQAANLSYANLVGIRLQGANLSGTNLERGDFQYAKLQEANLRLSNLRNANFCCADLVRADLTDSQIAGVDFSEANFHQADFSGASIGLSFFIDVDLGEVKGLDSVYQFGPSSIDLDTLYKSHGNIPDQFLRDAGVPEDVIEHLLPLIRTGPAIQFHSCFISYSTKDEEFARRLHGRMREAGLRVWFAPEDIKGGNKLFDQIDRAIQLHDKLLLILSENSIQSEWVMTEIRKAREVEKKENRRKLFPIRLVDFDTLRNWTCFDADSGKDLAVEVREYFIPDFSNWKNHDAFEAAFAKLLKDLKAEETKPKT